MLSIFETENILCQSRKTFQINDEILLIWEGFYFNKTKQNNQRSKAIINPEASILLAG